MSDAVTWPQSPWPFLIPAPVCVTPGLSLGLPTLCCHLTPDLGIVHSRGPRDVPVSRGAGVCAPCPLRALQAGFRADGTGPCWLTGRPSLAAVRSGQGHLLTGNCGQLGRGPGTRWPQPCRGWCWLACVWSWLCGGPSGPSWTGQLGVAPCYAEMSVGSWRPRWTLVSAGWLATSTPLSEFRWWPR